MKVAEIYLKQKNKRIDQIYEYLVPDEAQVGQRVNVEFGTGSRKLEGLIVNIKDQASYEGELKPITNFIDQEPILDEKQIQLCFYLSTQTFSLFYDTISHFTSGNKTIKTKEGEYKSYKLKDKEYYHLIEEKKVRGSLQQAVIEQLRSGKKEFSELKESIPKLTKSVLSRLIELGIIEKEIKTSLPSEPVEEVSFQLSDSISDKYFICSENEQDIVDTIREYYYKDPNSQILMIFPEGFKARKFSELLTEKYGLENGLYLGNLKPKEKHIFYHQIKKGSLRIIIGSSAALFLPYVNLKAVLVNDVGDASYLQSPSNDYNIINVAEKLSDIWNANFYAFDHVPSTLAHYKIQNNLWKEDKVEEGLKLPVNIQNINYLYKKEENHLISDYLYNKICKNIDEHQKTILFLNRKGYYNYNYCSECGEPIVCPECGSNLKSVRSGKEVTCRVCGYSNEFPEECIYCGNKHFKQSQFGIEKIEEQLRDIFPKAQIDSFYHGHIPNRDTADIIIGTKSLMYLPNFKNVATVAALLIDLDFDYPDYRATEDAYRLYYDFLTKYPEAELIIQTRSKDRSFIKALEGNSDEFFDDLRFYRKSVKLPPYHDVYSFSVFDADSRIINKEANILHKRIEELINDDSSDQILPIFKTRGNKGRLVCKFLVKVNNNNKFYNLIKKLYDNGEIEALQSKVSILINPANLS